MKYICLLFAFGSLYAMDPSDIGSANQDSEAYREAIQREHLRARREREENPTVADIEERHRLERQARRSTCDKFTTGMALGTVCALGAPLTMILLTRSVSITLYDPCSVILCFTAGFLSGYTGMAFPAANDVNPHRGAEMAERSRADQMSAHLDRIRQERQRQENAAYTRSQQPYRDPNY